MRRSKLLVRMYAAIQEDLPHFSSCKSTGQSYWGSKWARLCVQDGPDFKTVTHWQLLSLLTGTMGRPGDVMKCHLRELLLYFFSSFLAKIYWGELSAQFAIKPSCEVFERSCLNSPIFLSVKFAARRTRVLISVSLRNSPHSFYREVFSSISHRALTFSYPENKTVQQFSQYEL